MHPDFYKKNPFRPLRWRAERAIHLCDQPAPGPPRRYDDHPIRAYFFLLRDLLAVGDDLDLRERVILNYPHVYLAHQFSTADDSEPRQILEARLLTHDSLAEIAAKMGLEVQTVNYYEQLFFNVRDRLQHRDWITKAAIGRPTCGVANGQGSRSAAQRGYVYRLAAYHGGPLVLDALIGAPAETTPPKAQDIPACLTATQGDIIRVRAFAAAATLEVTSANCMRLLKLARNIFAAGETPADQSDYLSRAVEALCQYTNLEPLQRGPVPSDPTAPPTGPAEV